MEKAVSLQLYSFIEKMVSVRFSRKDLDHIIVLRVLSTELQMACSYHLSVALSFLTSGYQVMYQ